jgi:serine/threonine-protein kinase RsbW
LDTKEYNLEIPSDPANLITVEEFINFTACEAGIDSARMPGLLLAITEGTTNAIIHGNKKSPEKNVIIDAVIDDTFLTYHIKDQGTGFIPENVPDPTEPENLLKDSGRGLYLMRIYADELKYNITDSGTELILILKR